MRLDTNEEQVKDGKSVEHIITAPERVWWIHIGVIKLYQDLPSPVVFGHPESPLRGYIYRHGRSWYIDLQEWKSSTQPGARFRVLPIQHTPISIRGAKPCSPSPPRCVFLNAPHLRTSAYRRALAARATKASSTDPIEQGAESALRRGQEGPEGQVEH